MPAPASGAKEAALPPLTLTRFGNQAELGRFALRGIDAANFTPLGSDGAKVVFVKYKPGGVEWPALILRSDRGLPTGWGNYDVLAADVRNDSAAALDLAFHIEDSSGSKSARHYTIAPGKTETIRLPLAETGDVNLSKIREMQFFATRPSAEMTVELHNLRLETDADARRAAARETVATVQATYARLLTQTSDADVRAWVQGEQRSSEALQARFQSAEDRTTQSVLRRDLLDAAKRTEQTAPRRLSEIRLRRDFAKIDAKADYAVGFATSMEKVFPVDLPFRAAVSRRATVSLAGNETESLQILVLAGKQELRDVQVTVGPLTRTDGGVTLPASQVQVSPVGFVKTKRPNYKVDYVGWYPDPILDFLDKVTVKADEMQPIWLRVSAPKDTPPGLYKGTITVRPANAPPVTLELDVTVWGFSLTDETHLRTAVSFREPMIEQVYGTLTETMRQRYYRFLLQNRINPDNIYRYETPKIADLELWNREGMNAFNLTYVVKPADLKPNASYPPERKAAILAQLDAIIPVLKAKGLYSKAYVYGFDEVHPESHNAMRDVLGAIRERYPDLLIITTAYDATYGKKTDLPISVVNGWVPLTPQFNPARVAEARAEGKQIWWYTCIVPQKPYANWLIEYDAIEARSLMGLQTAKYRPDGYLYYAMNRWPLSKKPIMSGPYTDWATESFPGTNGDGSVLCAGPEGPLSTIRLENIRDGIEDNEYFWLLGEEIKKLKANGRPEARAALRQAEKANEIGKALVADMTHFSKSPEALYAKRRQVAEAIVAARKITER